MIPGIEIIGGTAAAAGSSVLGYMGQQDTNDMNLQIAREAMDFEERMSNTAHQRAADDMEAAGLNRILAAAQPASQPGGKTAVMDNEMNAAINSAGSFMQLAKANAEVKNIDANTRLTNNKKDSIEPIAQLMSTVGEYLKPASTSAKKSAVPAMSSLKNVLTGTAKQVTEAASSTAKQVHSKTEKMATRIQNWWNNEVMPEKTTGE